MTPFESIATAITQLLHPLVEVVIHDLPTDTISFITGNLSKRQVGDPSLLGDDEDIRSLEKNSAPFIYSKLNFDGRLVKSISIPLYEGETLTSLMCINADLSVFEDMKRLADSLMQTTSKQPDVLFKNDWQEKIHGAVHNLLRDKGWRFESLNNAQKKEIVRTLFKQGAFSEKNAADYIAKVLTMGRATVFNYLREFKQQ